MAAASFSQRSPRHHNDARPSGCSWDGWTWSVSTSEYCGLPSRKVLSCLVCGSTSATTSLSVASSSTTPAMVVPSGLPFQLMAGGRPVLGWP